MVIANVIVSVNMLSGDDLTGCQTNGPTEFENWLVCSDLSNCDLMSGGYRIAQGNFLIAHGNLLSRSKILQRYHHRVAGTQMDNFRDSNGLQSDRSRG